MNGVVGVDSATDQLTHLSLKYRAQNVYPYLRTKFHVTRLKGTNTSRAAVRNAVLAQGIVYVTGIGHGEMDAFGGAANNPFFRVGGYDPQEAHAKIIHLMSCLSALALGPDMVENGAHAFFGYDAAIVDSDDALACDSEIDLGFADGLSAREVYTRTMDAFDARIAELESRHFDASSLAFNQSHLCAPSTHGRFGNEDAHL